MFSKFDVITRMLCGLAMGVLIGSWIWVDTPSSISLIIITIIAVIGFLWSTVLSLMKKSLVNVGFAYDDGIKLVDEDLGHVVLSRMNIDGSDKELEKIDSLGNGFYRVK